MRKLSMKLEELEVETFTTESPAEERGTVVGRETDATDASCDHYASDCFYTCGRSCWGSCAVC